MSAELVRIGQQALAAVANSVAVGATLVECQLLASQFYEALRNELRVCPREDLVRRKILVAALNQCDQTAITGTNPDGMLKEFKSTIDFATDRGAFVRYATGRITTRAAGDRRRVPLIR